ncbi:MAG: STAS domain-containing protein [Gammaproteobacteria bacterium]|nr:STAS domain-containing protein [Gammaproteobacteria bacterium]MBU2222900.1 STAS domain-containing protein [Gammaproteobacteria bacterium]MBU2279336.1 STAS domain-containing protein [Gammaproteobacteria bacterium]
MLEIKQNGAVLQFVGELNCNTVVAHWPFKLMATLPKQAEFDLSGLQHVDTAGLAWLIQQMAKAKQLGISLKFKKMPEQLRSLASVSDVLALLPTE